VYFQPSVSGALSALKLLEFAELGGPWADSLPLKPGEEPADGTYMAVKPPVHFTRSPAERLSAETTYWKGIVHALWELYLEPRGITLETALEAVNRTYPALEEDRERSITGDHLSDRGWVEFDDQTGKTDWERYRWMIDQRRTTKPKPGRGKRHPLQCVECAVLSIQHRWPNDRLAKRYEWGSVDTASNYIRDGKALLTRS
jgi:hypothetical protein